MNDHDQQQFQHFCCKENVEDCLNFLNEDLVSIGMYALFDEVRNFHVSNLINATYELVQRCKRDASAKNLLEESKHRAVCELEHVRSEKFRLKSKIDGLERELNATKNKLDISERECITKETKIKSEREEIRCLQSTLRSREVQHKKATKKLESECNKLKERLNNIMVEKNDKKNGIAISNALLRKDGRRGKWRDVESTTSSNADEMYRDVVMSYERRAVGMLNENQTLRKDVRWMIEALHDITNKITNNNITNNNNIHYNNTNVINNNNIFVGNIGNNNVNNNNKNISNNNNNNINNNNYINTPYCFSGTQLADDDNKRNDNGGGKNFKVKNKFIIPTTIQSGAFEMPYMMVRGGMMEVVEGHLNVIISLLAVPTTSSSSTSSSLSLLAPLSSSPMNTRHIIFDYSPCKITSPIKRASSSRPQSAVSYRGGPCARSHNPGKHKTTTTSAAGTSASGTSSSRPPPPSTNHLTHRHHRRHHHQNGNIEASDDVISDVMGSGDEDDSSNNNNNNGNNNINNVGCDDDEDEFSKPKKMVRSLSYVMLVFSLMHSICSLVHISNVIPLCNSRLKQSFSGGGVGADEHQATEDDEKDSVESYDGDGGDDDYLVGGGADSGLIRDSFKKENKMITNNIVNTDNYNDGVKNSTFTVSSVDHDDDTFAIDEVGRNAGGINTLDDVSSHLSANISMEESFSKYLTESCKQ
ncbi:hypothetical protein HELRODRAFT_194022 [Helobdella robusta]|uniref:Uncharacterized protein n=1 Tax=Helobdella robusta TaxID=6412 RepID=T1FVK7_HELRO|nr:hypothetical protein HELRODRAFT_194022 [Helobdella robusta]ESN93678.1 hypothetical protein HELRODRAFT_194022 [Helobdella robusta]